MLHATSLFVAGMLALASAAPTPVPDCGGDNSTTANSGTISAPYLITAEQLIQMAPSTASCDASKPQCADAARAAPALSASFAKYKIEKPGEQSALIAIELWESVNFTFNTNQNDGTGKPRPGQGTRNMQMANFNREYVQSVLPEAEAKAVLAAADAGNPDALTTALNANDEISFGSAAWFMTQSSNVKNQKCTQAIRDGLAAGTKAGWDAFQTGCVGIVLDPLRDAPWLAAKKVLGVTAQ